MKYNKKRKDLRPSFSDISIVVIVQLFCQEIHFIISKEVNLFFVCTPGVAVYDFVMGEVMDKKSGKNFIVIMMIVSFAGAVGTFINGIFALLGTGGKEPAVGRMFVIAACFLAAGLIFRMVVRRQR